MFISSPDMKTKTYVQVLLKQLWKKKFWRPLVFSETFMIFFEEQKDLSSDAYNGLFHENTEISLRLKILIKAGVLSLK